MGAEMALVAAKKNKMTMLVSGEIKAKNLQSRIRQQKRCERVLTNS